MPDAPYLTIYASNRMEALVESLAEVVRTPLRSALAPEIIVVQSKGMERWIAMELARLTGVSANIRFPFPNAFLQALLNTFLPGLTANSGFDPSLVTFGIMNLLPEIADAPGFDRLNAYLSEDERALRKYQLCEQLSDVFDQYSVFRPEMISSWESGRGSHWQARLWRQLFKSYDLPHQAHLQKMLVKNIFEPSAGTVPNSAGNNGNQMPERVSLFGISYLPPIYLQTFAAISHLISVNLFLLNPCKEYWADIVSEKEVQKAARKYDHFDLKKDSLHLERGNRLLSSMGMQGRLFMHFLNDIESQTVETYVDPGEQTLLSAIQSDILNLEDRNSREQSTPSDVSGPDGSVQIHCCHSPMREIETLHDNLLSMFQDDPALHPKDVIVMAPDIELYAPYVRAVFDVQTDRGMRIPFSVADQSARTDRRVIDAFFALFDMKQSRFAASDVMRLLEYTAIREAFELSESDIGVLQHWIRDTRICWGRDADTRSGLGLPGFSENTWQAGIERLLLGYAMKGNGEDMFLGMLPYDEIEGADARILGKFLDFIETLNHTVDLMNTPKTLSGWQAALVEMAERFFPHNEDTERDLHTIRSIAAKLQDYQDVSGFDAPVTCDVIRAYIERQVEKTHFSGGFITGGVTFCSMMPMRSIPFKIVCLIGMNHDAFPRESRTPDFNLIAIYPKPGDRSRRNDDRYLFLESLISARNKLYISYIGQDIQDNTRKPPSVLVSELTDYIRQGFDIAEKHLVTRHRLQAFSRAYFTKGGRLFSFAKDNFDAARHLFDRQEAPPFVSAPLPALPGEDAAWKNLDLHSLGSFFINPARFFLQRRLGLYIESHDPILPKKERFTLDALQQHILSRHLLEKKLAGKKLTELLPAQQALGSLPHGNVGSAVYQKLSTEIDVFASRVGSIAAGERLEAVEVQLAIAGFTLNGKIAEIFEHGATFINFVNKRPKHLIKAWIDHLALCCSGHVKPSIILFRNAAIRIHPVEQAEKIVKNLLSVYWEGLHAPLHFFPETSHAFADQVLNRSCRAEDAIQSAKRKWEGNDFSGDGESTDPYNDLCFRRVDPFDEAFQSLALSVFSPIFDHCEQMPW